MEYTAFYPKFNLSNAYVYMESLTYGDANKYEEYLAKHVFRGLIGSRSFLESTRGGEMLRGSKFEQTMTKALEFLRLAAESERARELAYLNNQMSQNEVFKQYFNEFFKNTAFFSDGVVDMGMYTQFIAMLNMARMNNAQGLSNLAQFEEKVKNEKKRIEAYRRGRNYDKGRETFNGQTKTRAGWMKEIGDIPIKERTGAQNTFLSRLRTNQKAAYEYDDKDSRRASFTVGPRQIANTIMGTAKESIEELIQEVITEYLRQNPTNAIQYTANGITVDPRKFAAVLTVLNLRANEILRQSTLPALQNGLPGLFSSSGANRKTAKDAYKDQIRHSLDLHNFSKEVDTIVDSNFFMDLTNLGERYFGKYVDSGLAYSSSSTARKRALTMLLNKVAASANPTALAGKTGDARKKASVKVIKNMVGGGNSFTEEDAYAYIEEMYDSLRMIKDIKVKSETAEVLAAASDIQNKTCSFLNNGGNATTDLSGTYLDISVTIDDKLLAERVKTIMDRLRKNIAIKDRQKADMMKQTETYASNSRGTSVEDNTRIELENLRATEDLIEQARKELEAEQEGLGQALQAFKIETNVKGYQSIGVSKTHFEGQSFGQDLTEQLNTLESVANLSGMPFNKKWLTLALVNVADNTLGSSNFRRLETYLSTFASFLMFNDLEIEVMQIKDYIDNLAKGASGAYYNAPNINLYSLNGFLVPNSYILMLTYKSMKEAFEQDIPRITSFLDSSNIKNSGAVVRIDDYYVPEIFERNRDEQQGYSGPYPLTEERWREIGEQALAETKLKINLYFDITQFLDGMLGAINDLGGILT